MSCARARDENFVPAPAPVTRHGCHPVSTPAIRGHALPAGMPVCPPDLEEDGATGWAMTAARRGSPPTRFWLLATGSPSTDASEHNPGLTSFNALSIIYCSLPRSLPDPAAGGGRGAGLPGDDGCQAGRAAPIRASCAATITSSSNAWLGPLPRGRRSLSEEGEVVGRVELELGP